MPGETIRAEAVETTVHRDTITTSIVKVVVAVDKDTLTTWFVKAAEATDREIHHHQHRI